jgi:hypothetical protein
MSDVPSFLQDKPEPAAEPVIETTPAPVVEAPTGEPEPAPAPPAVQQEDRHVPLPALLDERDKRKAAEAEVENLRRWKADQEAKAKQSDPDFFADPDAALARQQRALQEALFHERLNTTEALARDKYGDDAVTAAQEAFAAAAQQSPALAVELQRQRNPYGYVMEWHKKQAALQRMGNDPDAWIEAEVQRRLAERVAASPVPPAPPIAPAPPRSLASVPSAGANRAPFKSGWDQITGG